jgi:sugar phosphate isomerase/epimerase
MSTTSRIPAALSLDGLGDDARAAFDLAANAGYAAVAIPTNHPELRPAELGPSARRHIQRIVRSKDLRIDALRIAAPRGGLTDPGTIQRTLDNARTGIAMAYDMDVHTIAVNAGNLTAPGVDFDSICAAARTIAEEADRAGITVAFGADGSDKLADLIKAVACDRARANLDTAREISSGVDPAAFIERLHGAIGQVTIADSIRSGPRARIVELGHGQLALSDLLNSLRQADFTGPIVVDVRDLPDAIHGAANAAKILRAIL